MNNKDLVYCIHEGDATAFAGQALHAAAVDFRHPRTGAPVKLRAPLPGDMRRLIRRIAP